MIVTQFVLFGGVEKRLVCFLRRESNLLRALTADATSQLHVLGHDGNPAGMNGTEVSVLEKSNQECFTGLLQSHHSG